MIICQTINSIRKVVAPLGDYAPKLAFVPTMGALHEGHINLVKRAKQSADFVAVSIFVNPTQFNDPADFTKYPKSLEQDIYLLEQAGTDLLFLPSVEEMYPANTLTAPIYELGHLENILEGAFRPGHFQGVCQAVHRLVNIVKPGVLMLGQKDYQQCMVVQKMITDLHLPVKLTIAPTVRDSDGLAMSSRNRRLSENARKIAPAIYEQLNFVAANASTHSLEWVTATATTNLLAAGFSKVDYVAICHATTLEQLHESNPEVPMVALVAAFLEEVRLIDNMPISTTVLPLPID